MANQGTLKPEGKKIEFAEIWLLWVNKVYILLTEYNSLQYNKQILRAHDGGQADTISRFARIITENQFP